jgi:predicted aspartyl protease
MQRLRKLFFCAIYLGVYSMPPSFPSSKASEAAPATAGVGLSRSTGNHLFVPVRINNRPAWFAVDTGAALSIVDLSKAKTLGLAKSSRFVELPNQIEVNNRIVPVAVVDSLYIGSGNLGSGPVALIDLRDFRAKLRDSGNPVSMDGILGLDILQRYHAVIDCHNQRIFLETPGTLPQTVVQYAKRNRYKAIPMRITHSGALEIAGGIGVNRYSFVVDTGGFATLLPLQVARQNGIPIIATTVNAKGIHSKERPVGVTIAPQFELANYSLGPILVGVTALPEGPDDLRYPFGGLIGADFFFEHHGIVDVGNRVLYFK